MKKVVYKLISEKDKSPGAVIRRIFGGVDMTWGKVLLLAVASAVVTTVFLTVKVFRDTSFERMGVHLEAWFLLAILIMPNCSTPLESALKTFVFFLVSQPLIYLLQVPFSSMGWGIFRYYGYWFLLTLLTFPMAYVGWYLKKRNWLSALIISPVLGFLGMIIYETGSACIRQFPRLIVTCIFCILQAVLYVIAFFPEGWWKKALGFVIPLLVIAFFVFFTDPVNITSSAFLPDDPVLTQDAYVQAGENAFAEVTVYSTGENSMIMIQAKRYGTMDFAIIDGNEEHLYTLEIYKDSGGHSQVRITTR